MKRVAKFYKVSQNEFLKSGSIEQYENVKLPERATKGSAGYDFFAHSDFTLEPNQTAKIPTGIRVKIEDGWLLSVFPRSSLGFKYRLRLDNTVGIIDSDYFNAENEGHIFIKLTNCGTETLTVKKGQAFAQGILLEYGITVDDGVTDLRIGGMGSTDKL